MNQWCRRLWLVVAVLVLPCSALAQEVAGTVRDTSGAVLPGVTVEVSSPVLIEKVRSAATDGGGQYRITDLRPGVYTVTFTLPGFNTVRREGLELAGGFNAQVNAELRIGALEETVTVTGESPIVDVQAAGRTSVVSQDVIAAIPSSRTPFSIAGLIPAVTYNAPGGPGQDLGGSNAISLASLVAFGGRTGDMRTNVEGLSTNNTEGSGQFAAWMPNMSSAQEITFDLSGGAAERPTGGVFVNVIPRDGGNVFSGTFFANGNGEWQSSNYDLDLQRRGLASPNKLQKVYDANGGFGGPIRSDRLWFYSAARRQVQNSYAGGYQNLNAGDPTKWTYEPDTTKPSVNPGLQWSYNARLTWQASPKNKIAVFYDKQYRCLCPRNVTALLTAEATSSFENPYTEFATATWSAPLTNRILIDAGWAHHPEKWQYPRHDTNMIGVTEQSTGRVYRGQVQTNQGGLFPQAPGLTENGRASFSYVTGSHALKTGVQYQYQIRRVSVTDNDYNLSYRFNNGIPNLLEQRTTPYETVVVSPGQYGLFLQDRWTVRRLTINAGVRFDTFDTYFPEQQFGPSTYVPNRNVVFPKTKWAAMKDITPRFGAVYDLRGDGRTALRFNSSKYMAGADLAGIPGSGSNPANLTVNTVTRPWNDINRNFVPDCNLVDVQANGECGRVSDLSFGNTRVASTTVDPGIVRGWGVRPYNWEFSGGIQHQLARGLSVDVGYFRRVYGNFYVTDNLAWDVSDFDEFSITAPVDPRLSTSGRVISGLYDVKPEKFGLVNNFVTLSDRYGKQTEHWDGVDVMFVSRLGQGILLQGGFNTGRTSTDVCEVRQQVPEMATSGVTPTTPWCNVTGLWMTNVKAYGSYTIPKVDLQTSVTFQSTAGTEILANYVATNAQILPSLGRPLSGANNRTVSLIEPRSLLGDRINNVDLRLSKVIRAGTTRTAISMDVYNLLNVNSVAAYNNNYAAWQQPTRIWLARFVKIGMQFDF